MGNIIRVCFIILLITNVIYNTPTKSQIHEVVRNPTSKLSNIKKNIVDARKELSDTFTKMWGNIQYAFKFSIPSAFKMF
ncbi:hypothetical protein FQR65_LT06405 [Abscondita terminalis]|nr:hypothetical protein FQR65_LT06405 [Abscondita terminalis]